MGYIAIATYSIIAYAVYFKCLHMHSPTSLFGTSVHMFIHAIVWQQCSALNIRMEKECDLGYFDHGMDIGARQLILMRKIREQWPDWFELT